IASGPTCPDPSTFADALGIVEKYGIAQPARVARRLERGAKGMLAETPKPGDPAFECVHNFLIGSNRMACAAAARYLRRSGLWTKYLGSSLLGGPAHELGSLLAALDLPTRSAVVAGGETTVRLGRYRHGRGGRNQEAALAFALAAGAKRDGEDNSVVAAFMGTDGVDGNSDAAGALVSSRVYKLAGKIGAEKYLARHDSYRALKKIGSLIFTGPTGTNVNDIAILVNYRDVA
ncbi:MAG: glycerate kinase, partial [Nitrososphaera sp.]